MLDIDDRLGRAASSAQFESRNRLPAPEYASSHNSRSTDIGDPKTEEVSAEYASEPIAFDDRQD
jgi:hypothetical protein